MARLIGFVLAAAFTVATAWAQPAPQPAELQAQRLQVQRAPVIAPQPVETTSSTFVLPAGAQWAPTRLSAQSGGRLQISVRDGRWSAEPPNARLSAAGVDTSTDANGYPDTAGQEGLMLPSANRGALIGRIGENGAPFLVGASFDGPAPGDGMLYLSMNEFADRFQDNQGRLSIAIVVTPPPPVETPPAAEEPAAEAQTPAPDTTQPPVAAEDDTPIVGEADEPRVPTIPQNLILAALAAVVGVIALFLLGRAFRPHPRADERRHPHVAPNITARVVSDGIAGQKLTIAMIGRR